MNRKLIAVINETTGQIYCLKEYQQNFPMPETCSEFVIIKGFIIMKMWGHIYTLNREKYALVQIEEEGEAIVTD